MPEPKFKTLLIIDDDSGFTTPLKQFVASFGYHVTVCESLADARKEISRAVPDIVLLDVILPDGSGMNLLKHPQASGIEKVIFITAHPYVETELGPLQEAGYTVLSKPVDPESLRQVLLEDKAYALTQPQLDELAKFRQPFDRMVGRSEAMQVCYAQIENAASSDAWVFLRGESGTGKELVAKTIHSLGRRASKPFVKLNCLGTDEDNALSILFGKSKDEATPEAIGFLEEADGGTLFLKNVNALPEHAQKKLRENLIENTSADGKNKALDVRIIASCYSDLDADTAGLDESFLNALSENEIRLPALREHREDIPLLAEYFLFLLNEMADANKNLSDKTLVTLMQYYWPGNVRELRNVLQQSFILATNGTIDETIVGERLSKNSHKLSDLITLNIGDSIAKAEKILILNTMEKTKGNKAAAAKILGISLKTLYNKLDLYTRNNRFEHNPG